MKRQVSDPIVTPPWANLVRLLRTIHRIGETPPIVRALAGVAGPL